MQCYVFSPTAEMKEYSRIYEAPVEVSSIVHSFKQYGHAPYVSIRPLNPLDIQDACGLAYIFYAGVFHLLALSDPDLFTMWDMNGIIYALQLYNPHLSEEELENERIKSLPMYGLAAVTDVTMDIAQPQLPVSQPEWVESCTIVCDS